MRCNLPDELPAIVRVRMRAGERREVRVLSNRGGPGRPLTDVELDLKFELNARVGLAGDAQVAALSEALERVDELPEIDELLALTVPAPHGERPSPHVSAAPASGVRRRRGTGVELGQHAARDPERLHAGRDAGVHHELDQGVLDLIARATVGQRALEMDLSAPQGG